MNGACCVALYVAWIQLQDLGGLLHQVVAWDASGRPQKVFPGLVFVDDDVASGVSTVTPVALCCDDPLHGMDGVDGPPAQGVRGQVVRGARCEIVHHVVVRLGAAGTTRTTM